MTATVERMLPLYEGKMGWQYDHRYASFFDVGDTDISSNVDRTDDAWVFPRYWVREEVVTDRLARRAWGSDSALLGFRRVARNTDERTVIASMLPFGAASYGWILSSGPDASDLALLIAQYNSFVVDYLLRQFLSQPSVPQGTFNQLPILPPEAFKTLDGVLRDTVQWVVSRVGVLVGSGEEMHAYVREIGRENTTPVHWDEPRRQRCRIEIDGAMFHLFGLARNDVNYIMESFPIVKRKDVGTFGSYRTKELVLVVYDAIQCAIDSDQPFVSPLDAELSELGKGA